MSPLAILIYITAFFVVLLISSFLLDDYKYSGLRETLQWISGIALVLVILFGWGGYGIASVQYTEILEIDGEISIGEKSITVDDYQRNSVYYFDKKIDFDNITDTTTFYMKHCYNMYNAISAKGVFYRVDKNEYWGETLKIN